MTEYEKYELEQEVLGEDSAEMPEYEFQGKQRRRTKESKGKFWKGVLVGSLVTAFGGILVVALAAGIWVVGRSVKTQEQSQMTPDAALEKVDESLDMSVIGPKLKGIEQAIDTYFLFDEKDAEEEARTKTMSAEDWIYTAYVMSFGDPYSSYYSVDDYQTLMDNTEGEYCGVGILVSQNVYTGVINILKVFKGAPADVAGILPGDILTGVDGLDVSGMDLSIVVSDHVKGEEGTDVTLTVYRESENEYIDLTMPRAIVQHPTVEYEMMEDNIGYINLSSFEDVSGVQFALAVEDLESQGMTALVLDIRNNTGGVVTAAEDIADYILPDGKDIVSFKGKALPDSTTVSKDGHQLDMPLVVLVNGQSASASEILSGCLGYHDSAVVVGTKTFGKGIAQGIFEIPDGSALKLTTAYYYLPSGECIHEKGIEPDVEVELKEELETMVEIPKEEDNQLQTAIAVLKEGEAVVKARMEAEKAAEEAMVKNVEEDLGKTDTE